LDLGIAGIFYRDLIDLGIAGNFTVMYGLP
jgi:hypothetical protein